MSPRRMVRDDGSSRVYEITNAEGERVGVDIEPSPGSPDLVAGQVGAQVADAIDALEPLLTKQAWTQADAATRWAIVRRVLVVSLKAARLVVSRLDSPGGDPT